MTKLLIDTIKDMIEYHKTSNMHIFPNFPKSYEPITENDIELFRIAVFEVLSWLSLGYEKELWKNRKMYNLDKRFFVTCFEYKCRQKPLRLYAKEPACILLKDVVEMDPQFSQCFIITHNKLDFKKSVTKEERIEVMKYVFNNYRIRRAPILIN